MADFDFQVSGLDQLNAALIELGTNGARRVGKRALRQGTNVVLYATRDAAPVKSGNLKNKGLYTHDRGISGDVISFSVDLKPNAFYGKFDEYGTSHQVAHPWMRPAAENSAAEAVTVTAVNLGAGIEAEWAKLV